MLRFLNVFRLFEKEFGERLCGVYLCHAKAIGDDSKAWYAFHITCIYHNQGVLLSFSVVQNLEMREV